MSDALNFEGCMEQRRVGRVARGGKVGGLQHPTPVL
jgi:hypothetical protein